MTFGTYVNPANAITASRYLTLPPFLYCLDKGQHQIALAILILNAVLDLLDGPAARLFKCTSGFGELFDAITDGICYAFFIICLMAYGMIPWIPIAIFLAMGVFNAWMRRQYTKRAGRATNFRSFAMERMVAYTIWMAGLGVAQFSINYYAWIIPFLMLVIIIHDYKRMILDPVPPVAPVPE